MKHGDHLAAGPLRVDGRRSDNERRHDCPAQRSNHTLPSRHGVSLLEIDPRPTVTSPATLDSRIRHYHGAARSEDEANENPNATPMVNSQSGAARLIPRRIPASRKTLDEVGCQMKPSRAELFGSSPCVLSPFTSPTSRRLRATGN